MQQIERKQRAPGKTDLERFLQIMNLGMNAASMYGSLSKIGSGEGLKGIAGKYSITNSPIALYEQTMVPKLDANWKTLGPPWANPF